MSADMWVGLLFIWAAVVWLVVGMFRVANAKPRPVPPGSEAVTRPRTWADER